MKPATTRDLRTQAIGKQGNGEINIYELKHLYTLIIFLVKMALEKLRYKNTSVQAPDCEEIKHFGT